MPNNKNHVKSVALTTLFIVGNSVIFIPAKEYSDSALFGLLLCFALSLILAPVYKKFHLAALKQSLAGKILLFSIIVFSLLCCFSAATDFSLVANQKILSSENYPVFSVVFAMLVFFILKAREEVLFKLALLFSVLCAFAIGVIFLVSLNRFDFSNLRSLNLNGTLYQSINFFAKCIAPTIVLPFLTESNRHLKKGFAFGFLAVLIPLLQIILIFGTDYGETLDFAFLSVLNTVSIGMKFSRLEGLAYVFFLFSSLIRCSVCLLCAKKIITAFLKKIERLLPFILSVFLFTSTIFSEAVAKINGFLNATIAFLALIFFIGVALLKNRTRCQYKTM